jgi:hypothetical protein
LSLMESLLSTLIMLDKTVKSAGLIEEKL